MNVTKDLLAKQRKNARITPDKQKVSPIQATRLAAQTNLALADITGKAHAELAERYRWEVDSRLFTHRRVCGRVVQEDPATGELWGVPNAVVEVEDSDCSFISYFPPDGLYGWVYPYHCQREVIATAVTDECGRFCVWIPYWDIDYVINWRRERLCFPDLVPPRVCDVLKLDLGNLEELVVRPPGEQPNPSPLRLDIERVRQIGGDAVAALARRGLEAATFGAPTDDLHRALHAPVRAFAPPPLCSSTLEPYRLEKEAIAAIQSGMWQGPYLRCIDVVYPQISIIQDAPDITFRVTQQVGDTSQVVYAEGAFQVRWDDTNNDDIELRANGTALATPLCDGPEIDPGECNAPTLVTAGLMPLGTSTTVGYHDHGTGYALRPNRPRDGAGVPQTPANAPYLGTVQLHGCQRFEGAQFYRVLHALQGAPESPFLGVSWYTPLADGTGNLHVVPDADGWYAVLDPADLVFPHWLFNWVTQHDQNGRHAVRLEIADGARNSLGFSAPIEFTVDNSRPLVDVNTLRWRDVTLGGAWQSLDTDCPVIRRAATSAIEIEVVYQVSATHLRDVQVNAADCDGNALTRLTSPASASHWHTNAADNSYGSTVRYAVAPGAVEGPYTVSVIAHGRAFNPAGSDQGPSTDWYYDPSYARSDYRASICIINT